jgi:hypothetical protein
MKWKKSLIEKASSQQILQQTLGRTSISVVAKCFFVATAQRLESKKQTSNKEPPLNSSILSKCLSYFKNPPLPRNIACSCDVVVKFKHTHFSKRLKGGGEIFREEFFLHETRDQISRWLEGVVGEFFRHVSIGQL